MSSKICQRRETHAARQVSSERQLQKLDITLQNKMNSEQEPTNDPILEDGSINESSASENGPLSERQLSNFDNQTNVKI